MKVISFDDIINLKIHPLCCYDWAESMIKEKRKALLPPKISMKPSEGVFCNVMPSMLMDVMDMEYGGVKVVTRYPNRTPSLESRILLMDSISGEFLALMDGTWITAMRTGAVAAHSIILLGKRGFSRIGIMGLGNVSRATLWVLSEKLSDRKLIVKLLRYKGQEEDFTKRFSDFKNLEFCYVDSAEEMVKGSEIVISGATYLPQDVCADECFEEGVLVVPIHTLGFTNCDLFFDKVYADDLGHVQHFKNFSRFRKFGEVCDVVNGNILGRENDNERILVYNIGISVHDIRYAAEIYKRMKEEGRLEQLAEVDLEDPTEKFWV